MARADELRGERAGGPARLPWWCPAGVALVHFALLASGAQALSDWKREQWLPKAAATPVALQVRYVAAAAVATMAAVAEPAPAAAAAPGPATLSPPPAPAPEQQQQAEAEPAPPPEQALPVVEAPVYVPRALLSVGPVARAPVLLQWPPNWPLRRTYTAVLRLYLDEQGRVERVEPDGDVALPEALFETARQAFLAADFSPGQLQGQAVKSWMRIEVSFESATTAAPP